MVGWHTGFIFSSIGPSDSSRRRRIGHDYQGAKLRQVTASTENLESKERKGRGFVNERTGG